MFVFLVIAAAGLAADLASKHLAFEHLLADPRLQNPVAPVPYGATTSQALVHLRRQGLLEQQLLPGVRLTVSTNPGVVFGLAMPRWAVLVATVVTTALVVAFFATSGAGAWLFHAALGMILAGALGNLYDRLCSEVAVPGLAAEPIRRHVRDFIDCSGLYYPWVFNVADMLLVVGVALLIVHGWTTGRRKPCGAANHKSQAPNPKQIPNAKHQ